MQRNKFMSYRYQSYVGNGVSLDGCLPRDALRCSLG